MYLIQVGADGTMTSVKKNPNFSVTNIDAYLEQKID